MLEIMTASAGSGKTYNLVLNYIRLLLENVDRYTYRRILAVTFTNKATDEMKGRILLELHRLATDTAKSPYRNVFIPLIFSTEADLQKKSEIVLRDILHDYSAFSVSTIDKFFQQTLKAFSKEIGQFASYQVELDKDSLITESVDRILDSLTSDSQDLLSWLTQNVLDQIESGEKYSLEKTLMASATRLKSNQRKEALERAGIDEKSAYTIENLNNIRKKCREIKDSFRQNIIEQAKACEEALNNAGVSVEDSNRGFMKVFANYAYLEPFEEIKYPTDSVMDKLLDEDKWFAKSKATKRGLLGKDFYDAIGVFCRLLTEDYKVYQTAQILDRQIYGLGIAGELNKAFNEVMKEKNVLCIDDSNTILRDIIDGSDAPFVYEKTGVRYDHFLLDEFQDTSEVQWQNFKPLLVESISNGCANLIVGDVKQSIYRWRGSDWQLLKSTVPSDFPEHEVNPLDTNWRSLGNIIRFNNVFFKTTSRVLSPVIGDKYGDLSEIYADVEQNIAKAKDSGSVSITFCDKFVFDDSENLDDAGNPKKVEFSAKDMELEAIMTSIEELLEKGAKYSDIAILVRGNSTGGSIAEYLTDKGIPIVTDDSLAVKNSLTVRRIVSLMSLADNPKDTVRSYLATQLDVKLPERYNSLMDLAEYLLRSLKARDEKDSWKGEALHIQSFFDFLQDYVSSEGNDLRGFLRHFEDKNPPISSPSTGNSVRIMTIHKSKGLDFQYVILPFAENIGFYKESKYWSIPDLKGTPLDGVADGVYDVSLSASSQMTLFSESYEQERFLQLVDNMNILYVALTRAVLGMHIIAKTPAKTFREGFVKKGCSSFKDFSQVLWWFATASQQSSMFDEDNDELLPSGQSVQFVRNRDERFDHYERYDYGELVNFADFRKSDASVEAFPLSDYGELPSYSLNPEGVELQGDVKERGRLKFSADSLDFFSDDADPGIASSNRIKGVVLHDILSRVVYKEDLQASITQALAHGEITSEEAGSISDLLEQRIGEGVAYGWFPEKDSGVRVLNEMSLMDSDGREYRPDRVVVEGKKVIIIDYKTGVHDKKYESQLHKYADIWKRMGYSDLVAVLWYIQSGECYKVE